MYTPETSQLFTRWQNPSTGVESFILTERPASVQMNFYYISPSFTNDGRYLWLRCQFVPSGGYGAQPVLGVVDFERDEMRVYHDTQFAVSSPGVDLETGDVYWATGLDVWKRGPRADDKDHRINRFPQDIAKGRTTDRITSHFTFSADRKSLNLDAQFDNECYIGDMPLDGSAARIWDRLEGVYNHGQFSPTNPDAILFANEYWKWHAPFDGQVKYHRLWLARRGEKAQPVLREPVTHSGHEWWDAAGQHLWYVHYGVGIKKVDLKTRHEQNIWPGHLSHGHSDRTSRYLAADLMADPKVSDCHVEFFDTQTKKQIEIVNRPPLAGHLTQAGHLHPHPQFCCNDRYICYTTIIHDRVDIALTPTAPLRGQ
jgi:hypothetical protein